MLSQLKLWGVNQFILNATYVEQKMKDFANKMGLEHYAFLRQDYNECLELFEIDLSQKLAPEKLISLKFSVLFVREQTRWKQRLLGTLETLKYEEFKKKRTV